MRQKMLKAGSVPASHTQKHTHYHRFVIFVMMLFMLMLNPDVGWGQGCNELLNNNNRHFSMIDLPDPIDPVGGGSSAYELGWINEWFASHGSPHKIQIDPNKIGQLAPCERLWTTQNGDEINCMVNEGLFTNYNFSSDPNITYTLQLGLNGLNCGVWQSGNRFNIALTAGLVPGTYLNPILDFPNVNKDIIISHTIPNGNTDFITLTTNFYGSRTDGYNQIWLYQDENNGIAQWHDISLTCTTSALSDITTTQYSDLNYSFGTVNASSMSTFQSYSWTITNTATNTLVFNSNDASPSVSFPGGGTYNVCVKIVDNNGCCATLCEDIEVNCTPPITNYTISGNCPTYTFTPTNPDPDATYSWDFGDGSTTTNQAPTHTYAASGSYTVTLRVVKCGISYNSTQTVVVDCIDQSRCDSLKNNTRYLTIDCGVTPTLWSEYAINHSLTVNAIYSSLVYLKGTLIFDVPVQIGHPISLGEWTLDDGAQIIVNSNVFALNTHFKGCLSMWKGFNVQSGNLSLSKCTVEDAHYGVNLNGGSTNLSKVTFLNNVIGFNSNVGTTSPNQCGFKCTGVLKPPYLGQMNYPTDGLTYAGIKLNNCGSFSTGIAVSPYINFFDGIRNGIIAINTNLSIYKNEFSNIKGASEDNYASSSAMSGYGIIASGASIYNIDNNTISGCNIGISVNNAQAAKIKIKNNKVGGFNKSGAYGVYCNSNFGGFVEVNTNTITNGHNSIALDNNLGSTNKVEGNNITNAQSFPNAIEIAVSCNTCPESGNTINGNTIHTSKADIGIMSLKVKKNIIYNNVLTFNGQNEPIGIIVSNAPETQVSSNVVNGQAGLGLGYQAFQSPNAYIDCNAAYNMKTGVLFYGMAPGSTFRSNLMANQTLEGLKLNSANIGIQPHRGNLWYGNVRKAVALNSLPFNNRFFVNSNYSVPFIPGLSNGTYFPTTTPSTGWFFDEPGSDLNCWNGDYINEPLNNEEIIEAMVSGDGADTGYDDYNRWFMTKEAYKMIGSNQNNIQSKELMDFYYSADDRIAKFVSMEQQLSNVYSRIEAETDQQSNLEQQLEYWTSEINRLEGDLTLTAENRITAMTLAKGNIEILTSSLQNLTIVQIERRATLLNALRPIIITLPAETEYLQDYKAMLLAMIDFQMMDKQSFVSANLPLITEISQKCILSNGEAVTMAQNILRALGQSYTPAYDCAVSNNRSKVTKAEDDQVTITPNPAYNAIQIRLNDGQSISTVQCRNLEGKVVNVWTNGQLDVYDISNLNPGVYIIRVTLSNGSVTDKRFIKIN